MRYKYQYARLSFDYNAGEGDVSFMNDFEEQDWIVQADALVDWIQILQDKYKTLLFENNIEV